ncbi:hypothetical protein CDL15_Pgr009931 [Punica granatum]|uniref:Mei2-like C-terminal RNA recognition motif domain-containing protein n=1 Tax=Punica granatum TaxID=22663 RepID=A0A218WU43_PUNGR|nr:hypothetical protein CDL15_Pgr009931 [Punica granatum]
MIILDRDGIYLLSLYQIREVLRVGDASASEEAFDGKKWEKFNSEKVASLAYARIQGKAALIARFRNSSLMNGDKRCRPILFDTEGPNAGDQVPFPMGVNVRARPGKSRTGNPEDNNQGNRSSLPNGEDSSHGHLDTSTGCAKESD